MKNFKLIVAGGRDFNDRELMCTEINSALNCPAMSDSLVEIVSGMAAGADTLAYEIAIRSGYKVHEFPANWGKYGKRAGYIRNKEMADFSDGLLAFWDGKSRGTFHMINIAMEKGMWIKVVRYPTKNPDWK